MGVEVYLNSDGETYHKLPEDLQIGEVDGTIEKIKIVLRSSQADLFPDETISIKEIKLELSNKPNSKLK